MRGLPETQAAAVHRLQGERQVVQYAQTQKHIGDLVAARQAAVHAAVDGLVGDVVAVKHNVASVGVQRAGDLVDECGLACAVGANQCVDLARLHRQLGVVGRGQCAKALHQIFHLQQRCGAHAALRFSRLIRPCGATSTTSKSRAPRPNCQCSVIWPKNSSMSKKAAAPTRPPSTWPTPPRITITISMPDWLHCMSDGLTKLPWLASSAPARPASAPASVKATSL